MLDGREQISLMDIDPKLSRPLLRVATITRVLTLPGLVPAEGLKTENFTEFFCYYPKHIIPGGNLRSLGHLNLASIGFTDFIRCLIFDLSFFTNAEVGTFR